MRVLAGFLFAAGVLLAVRVMFFGVRRSRGSELVHRAGPLSLAAALVATGALLYVHVALGVAVTIIAVSWVLPVGALAGLGAWWVVHVSAAAAAATNDPDDDPKFRFQGYVARVVRAIQEETEDGRVAFIVDGQRLELAAKWIPGNTAMTSVGAVDSEVVIERVDGDIAYVEPWALVENRL